MLRGCAPPSNGIWRVVAPAEYARHGRRTRTIEHETACNYPQRRSVAGGAAVARDALQQRDPAGLDLSRRPHGHRGAGGLGATRHRAGRHARRRHDRQPAERELRQRGRTGAGAVRAVSGADSGRAGADHRLDHRYDAAIPWRFRPGRRAAARAADVQPGASRLALHLAAARGHRNTTAGRLRHHGAGLVAWRRPRGAR